MIVCPVCKFRNPDSNDHCFRCSALLKRNDEAMQQAKNNAARKMRRVRLSNPLAAPIDWLRHRPWLSRMFAIPDYAHYRYPFTAGLLSILPGAGHWYAGQPAKGVVIFVIWLMLFAIALATLRAGWSNVLLFSLLILWLLVWADSVAVAAQSNGDTWRFRKTLALLFGAMMIIGVTVQVTQYLGLGLVSFQRATSDSMQPWISRGDRLLFTSVPLWFRNPRPGEVVSFDPPRFTATQAKDVYSVNVKRYFQRVLGGPGDRVTKQGNKFFRNGAQLTPSQEPFGGQDLPDFDVVVPEGSWFIPVTRIPQDAFASLAGAGSISYVGQPDFSFNDFPGQAIVKDDDIQAKGIAILSPPPHRRWLN